VLTTEGLVVNLRPTEAGKGREEYGERPVQLVAVSSDTCLQRSSQGGGAVSLRCRQYSTLALLLIFG
jgi:hypothetical protein